MLSHSDISFRYSTTTAETMSTKRLQAASHIRAAPQFSMSTSGRFSEMKAVVPGPGSYQTAAGTDSTFTEVGVKFAKKGGFSWGSAPRRKDFADATRNVGPGSYDWTHELSRPSSVRGGTSQAPRSILKSNRDRATGEPGPGQYDHKNFLGSGPAYTPSKNSRFNKREVGCCECVLSRGQCARGGDGASFMWKYCCGCPCSLRVASALDCGSSPSSLCCPLLLPLGAGPRAGRIQPQRLGEQRACEEGRFA